MRAATPLTVSFKTYTHTHTEREKGYRDGLGRRRTSASKTDPRTMRTDSVPTEEPSQALWEGIQTKLPCFVCACVRHDLPSE